MPVYEKCKVFTCSYACNLHVIIDSVCTWSQVNHKLSRGSIKYSIVNPNYFSSIIEQLLSISELRGAPLGPDSSRLKSLFVSRVGLNLCLTNWIRICSLYKSMKTVCYFVGVVYITTFRINMLILSIFSLTSSLRSMETPNPNVHVRVSSWTYKYWYLTGNPTLTEEVFSRQKKSG